MEIIFSNKQLEKLCTDLCKARKECGDIISRNLLSRIQLLRAAETIEDVIKMPTLNFHGLKGKGKGTFAIDVKSRKDPWRILLEPLNENNERFKPCNIDEIASEVRKILIIKVSKHYE